ncbi:MAG: hypothetical protein K2N18_00105 [Clostridia bacterium]|nr:hypothetical protein [Clostridia bacterium]
MSVSNLLSATVSPEVIAAIIALIGVLVSVLITLILGLATRKYNYNQLFAQTVSSNRMEWINVWRENISTFLACAKVLHKYYSAGASAIDNNSAKDDKFDENDYLFKLEQSRTMITTRLNLKEDMHVMMFGAINQLDYGKDNGKFNLQCEYIEELARSILKPEWERVKEEAKAKRR